MEKIKESFLSFINLKLTQLIKISAQLTDYSTSHQTRVVNASGPCLLIASL